MSDLSLSSILWKNYPQYAPRPDHPNEYPGDYRYAWAKENPGLANFLASVPMALGALRSGPGAEFGNLNVKAGAIERNLPMTKEHAVWHWAKRPIDPGIVEGSAWKNFQPGIETHETITDAFDPTFIGAKSDQLYRGPNTPNNQNQPFRPGDWRDEWLRPEKHAADLEQLAREKAQSTNPPYPRDTQWEDAVKAIIDKSAPDPMSSLGLLRGNPQAFQNPLTEFKVGGALNTPNPALSPNSATLPGGNLSHVPRIDYRGQISPEQFKGADFSSLVEAEPYFQKQIADAYARGADTSLWQEALEGARREMRIRRAGSGLFPVKPQE